MDFRKNWTAQQNTLRQYLSARAHFDQAIPLFLSQHAATHTAAISGGEGWSLYDEVIDGLSDAQIQTCPKPGVNSIAWLLWHITRIEDMTINFLVLDQPQVFDRADWSARLGLSLRDVGASWDDAQVASFSAQICVQGLKDYRTAVGQSTCESILQLSADQAKEIVPTPTVYRLAEEGSISPKGIWLAEYYTNRTRGFFLTRTATSHNFIHLNEAGRVAAKLKKATPTS